MARCRFLRGASRAPGLRHLERWSVRFLGLSWVGWHATSRAGVSYVPTLLLETARGGRRRAVPLFYVPAGDGWAVVGSHGGSAEHPRWVHDLFRVPRAHVVVGGRRHPVEALLAEGRPRQACWRALVAVWPDYAVYQVRAGTRELPVFLLRPDSSRT